MRTCAKCAYRNISYILMTTLTLKLDTLYAAYAPEFDVSAYGGCRDEALNNLADEIAERRSRGVGTLANLESSSARAILQAQHTKHY